MILDDSLIRYMSSEEAARRCLRTVERTHKRRKYLINQVSSAGGEAVMEAFRIISHWPKGYIVKEATDNELRRLNRTYGSLKSSSSKRRGRSELYQRSR